MNLSLAPNIVFTAEEKKTFYSLGSLCKPHSLEKPTDWACKNILFPAPGRNVPFDIKGREFIREPLDCFANPRIRFITFISGSQIGKTAMLMAGAGYTVRNRPSRIFWVMPTIRDYLKFYKSRLKPLEIKSPGIKDLIKNPRVNLTAELQFIGSSIIEMTGSNTPSGLAGSPCRVVILDEVGKFKLKVGEEGGAVGLAQQRVKDFPQSLIVCTSTPVSQTSPEWVEYLNGDQRRYHIPCIHCEKPITLAWSPNFNALPRLGNEAYVEWDSNAKIGSKWDLGIVARTAHFVCPFCKGKIFDHEKSLMVPRGEWIATNPNGDTSRRSYHISSLYAAAASTSVGNEAVNFLRQKKARQLQIFANGELAEPWFNQVASKRSELIISTSTPHEGEWFNFLTADYHYNAPFLWYVVRAWNRKGDSYLLDFGNTNDFAKLDQLAEKYKIPPTQVFIDSGYDANRIYQECLNRGRREAYPPGGVGRRKAYAYPPSWVHLGWTPLKGYATQKNWRDEETGTPRIFDWVEAETNNSDVALPVLLLYTTRLKDILRSMRLGESDQKWAVTDIVDKSDVYWVHLDSEELKELRNGTFVWEKKNPHLANHLLDCEVYQIGAAVSFGLITTEEKEEFVGV